MYQNVLLVTFLNLILFMISLVFSLIVFVITVLLYMRTKHRGFVILSLGFGIETASRIFSYVANIIIPPTLPPSGMLLFISLLSSINLVATVIMSILIIAGLVLLANDLSADLQKTFG